MSSGTIFAVDQQEKEEFWQWMTTHSQCLRNGATLAPSTVKVLHNRQVIEGVQAFPHRLLMRLKQYEKGQVCGMDKFSSIPEWVYKEPFRLFEKQDLCPWKDSTGVVDGTTRTKLMVRGGQEASRPSRHSAGFGVWFPHSFWYQWGRYHTEVFWTFFYTGHPWFDKLGHALQPNKVLQPNQPALFCQHQDIGSMVEQHIVCNNVCTI